MDLLILMMTSKKRRTDFSLPKAKRFRNLLEGEEDAFGFPYAVQSNTHADFRYNHKLCTNHFKQIAQMAPAIQHLDLTGCYSLPVEALPEITRLWGHCLKSLNLECCNSITQSIHLTVPNTSYLVLQKLSLANSDVTDLGVRFFATRAPDLVDINLQGCSKITDSSLSIIAQFCKKVRVLNVSGCDKITNYAIQIIAQEANYHLEELYLNDCRQITGGVLEHLAFYCPNLKRLSLRDTSVSGDEVALLCKKLSLAELNLQGLSISDDDLLSIATSQYNLEILDVSFCHKISEKGLQKGLSWCTNLHELRAYGKNVFFSDEISSVTVYS